MAGDFRCHFGPQTAGCQRLGAVAANQAFCSRGGAVVVVTGYADLDGAISAMRYGASEYILKPINSDALRASLARIVDRLRTNEELRESQQHLQSERDFAENLLNTAQIIILVLDTQGRIVQFNPYLEKSADTHWQK